MSEENKIIDFEIPKLSPSIIMVTGVGGGVLRDIMAGETPYILVREIYASAAIAGGITCVVCGSTMGEATATILGLIVTIVIRSLAAYFHWNVLRIR